MIVPYVWYIGNQKSFNFSEQKITQSSVPFVFNESRKKLDYIKDTLSFVRFYMILMLIYSMHMKFLIANLWLSHCFFFTIPQTNSKIKSIFYDSPNQFNYKKHFSFQHIHNASRFFIASKYKSYVYLSAPNVINNTGCTFLPFNPVSPPHTTSYIFKMHSTKKNYAQP